MLKNIPLAVNRRLNDISSNKESFDEVSLQIRAEVAMTKLTNAIVGTSECPLDGHCLTNKVIYQATETYIGSTENHFKTRYRNHLASFKDKSKKNATYTQPQKLITTTVCFIQREFTFRVNIKCENQKYK